VTARRYLCATMARPIEPTPTLEGDDADALLADISKTITPEEAERRRREAKEYLTNVKQPKTRGAS